MGKVGKSKKLAISSSHPDELESETLHHEFVASDLETCSQFHVISVALMRASHNKNLQFCLFCLMKKKLNVLQIAQLPFLRYFVSVSLLIS